MEGGGRFTPDKAGAGARRAAEGLRPERGHAGVDAPGEGPQRRAKSAAKAQPWSGAGRAVYFGQPCPNPKFQILSCLSALVVNPRSAVSQFPKFRDGNAGSFDEGLGSREKGIVSWTGRAKSFPLRFAGQA